jgi:CMP-N,N'-diacetyllegionaminic acid synthase
VPNKHTRLMCGKPLLAWTVEAALQSKYLEVYAVSSDSRDILKTAGEHGAFVIPRPPELAEDFTPTLPALQHAVNKISFQGEVFDYIIEIRATSPLKTTQDIDGCIERLLETGADSVIGVTALEDHHPARAKWLDERNYIHSFLPENQSGRRQDLTPKAFIRNGTVYAFKRDAVMGEHGKLFGHEFSVGYEMPADRSVNIDTELDWKLAELLMKERGAQ